MYKVIRNEKYETPKYLGFEHGDLQNLFPIWLEESFDRRVFQRKTFEEAKEFSDKFGGSPLELTASISFDKKDE